MRSFRFRALRPLFVDRPITLNGAVEGEQVRLWAQDGSGAIAMEAGAEFET
jgi:hydroxyacyl-ACP dehydratase HTD2-like protein with hotdog domain